jgi:hypothetical protein
MVPPCVDDSELYMQRPQSVTFRHDANWRQTTTDLRKVFAKHQEVAATGAQASD